VVSEEGELLDKSKSTDEENPFPEDAGTPEE